MPAKKKPVKKPKPLTELEQHVLDNVIAEMWEKRWRKMFEAMQKAVLRMKIK